MVNHHQFRIIDILIIESQVTAIKCEIIVNIMSIFVTHTDTSFLRTVESEQVAPPCLGQH